MPIFLSYPCNRISLNHVLGNINVPLISLITLESVVLSFSVRIRWSVPMTHTHRDRSFIGSVLYKDVNFLRSSTYLPVLFSYSSFPSYPLHLQPLSQHTHTEFCVLLLQEKAKKRKKYPRTACLLAFVFQKFSGREVGDLSWLVRQRQRFWTSRFSEDLGSQGPWRRQSVGRKELSWGLGKMKPRHLCSPPHHKGPHRGSGRWPVPPKPSEAGLCISVTVKSHRWDQVTEIEFFASGEIWGLKMF